MEADTTVLCTRLTWYPDRLRKYKIVADGEVVQALRAGDTVSFEIQPGQHDLFIKMDWMRSNRISLQCRAGGVVALECGSKIQGWLHFLIPVLAPYYYFIKPHDYLWLRLRSGSENFAEAEIRAAVEQPQSRRTSGGMLPKPSLGIGRYRFF